MLHFLTITLAVQENNDNVVTILCPEQYKKEWKA